MTITSNHRPRRVVVVGSTFGQMYLNALRQRPDIVVTGLLSRGSARSQRLADAYDVPLLTRVDDACQAADLACVVIRSDGIGGSGTSVASRLLEQGVPVLHEMPASSADVSDCLRAARTGRTRFRVADLYRWLPSVRVFRASARELLATESPLGIDAHLSIQPTYALARLLSEIGLPTRPTLLHPSADGTAVTGTVGTTPLTVRFATILDALDTDNDVRFPAVSVHTRSGTLTLADVHGPVLWTPTLHLPATIRDDPRPDGRTLSDVAACTVLHDPHHSHGDVLASVWPTALGREIAAMFDRAPDGSDQRSLHVARLWEQLTHGVEFPATASSVSASDQRTHLLARMRTAADRALDDSPAPKEDEE